MAEVWSGVGLWRVLSAPNKPECSRWAYSACRVRRGDLRTAHWCCGEDGAVLVHGRKGGCGGGAEALGTGGMGILGGRTEAKASRQTTRVGQG